MQSSVTALRVLPYIVSTIAPQIGPTIEEAAQVAVPLPVY